jgi:hypothetical protein
MLQSGSNGKEREGGRGRGIHRHTEIDGRDSWSTPLRWYQVPWCCHVHEMWLWTDFGLMIGFIGLFDRARDYILQFTVTYTHTHTSVHSQVFTSRCSVAASNGGLSLSSRFPNYPWLQLPGSHSNSSQILSLSSSLTHWLTNSVTHHPTNSTQLSRMTKFTPH